MRELAGTPIGISEPIMGVITKKPKIFSKLDHQILLIHPNGRGNSFRGWFANKKLSAIIAYESIKALPVKEFPSIVNISEDKCSELNEGDVALIEPDGKIKVFYEIESPITACLSPIGAIAVVSHARSRQQMIQKICWIKLFY